MLNQVQHDGVADFMQKKPPFDIDPPGDRDTVVAQI
jgi:hypothetical protein